MAHYDFNTLGPKGQGKPYYSFCQARNPGVALGIAINRWIEEYGSIDKMMLFHVYNHDRDGSWLYEILPVIRGCGRYKIRLMPSKKRNG